MLCDRLGKGMAVELQGDSVREPGLRAGTRVRKRTGFSQPLLPAVTALERNMITDCYEPTTMKLGWHVFNKNVANMPIFYLWRITLVRTFGNFNYLVLHRFR